MENRFLKIIVTIMASLFALAAVAQNEKPEMADLFRSEGKIFVVVAVLVIIFAGIVVYLITIDKKARKLEKEFEELKK